MLEIFSKKARKKKEREKRFEQTATTKARVIAFCNHIIQTGQYQEGDLKTINFLIDRLTKAKAKIQGK